MKPSFKTQREELVYDLYCCMCCMQHVRLVDPFGCDAIQAIREAAIIVEEKHHKPVKVLLYKITNSFEANAVLDQDTFLEAINAIMAVPNLQNTVIVLERIEYFLQNDSQLQQRVLDFLLYTKYNGNVVVFISPEGTTQFPTGISELIKVFSFPYPGKAELHATVKSTYDIYVDQYITNPIPEDAEKYAKGQVIIEATEDNLWEWALCLMGLPKVVAEDSIRECVKSNCGLSKELGSLLVKDKIARLKVAGMRLELSTTDIDKDVGGLSRGKKVFYGIKKSFTARAISKNVRPPSAILLPGPTGTGKTFLASCLGVVLNMPVLFYESPRQSLMGESEKKTAQYFAVAKATRAILFIDEGEKQFGQHGGSASEGPTSGNILQIALSRTQDNANVLRSPELMEKEGYFIMVVTTNDGSAFPIEFINRMELKMALDLPNTKEREEILKIHLKNNKVDPDTVNITEIVSALKGYSSREISTICINTNREKLYDTDDSEDYTITTADLLKEISQTTSVSVMAPESIKKQREWCIKNNIKTANSPDTEVVTTANVKL